MKITEVSYQSSRNIELVYLQVHYIVDALT
jgi:hypothetical protein